MLLVTQPLSYLNRLFFNVIALTFCWLSTSSYAIELEHLVTFDKVENTHFNWQQITPHPSLENYFYVFSEQGHIKQIIKGEMQDNPILTLSDALKQNNIKLTSLVLHPNFSLKDLPGYRVFYTAHQEIFNDKRRFLRLPKTPLKDAEYDLVMNEWQLLENEDKADINSKREIIRIASPAQTTFIQQLSFNPYLKPWQDDFGALFMVLNDNEKHRKTPLYSGVVLKIHPDKFGLRNYTIPDTNVFNNDLDIDNEIVALGAKNIVKIIWQKKNNKQWFFLAEQEKKSMLSLINNGDDLRKETISPLWQSKISADIQHIIWYEGRKLTGLLYKLITLDFTGNQWKLNSLTISANKTIEEVMLTSIINRDPNARLGLMVNNDAELILVNATDGIMSQINSITGNTIINDNMDDGNAKSSSISEETLQQIYLWLVVLLIMGLGFFTVKKVKAYDREKALVRKLYARFELSHQGQRINFYKRHKKEAALTIPLSDIASSKVTLNNEVINLIDEQALNVFNTVAKVEMHKKFSLEHRLKMVDNRPRNIIVEITDKKQNTYKVCLYVRRGNQRYTRINYQECLNIITAWCWTVSEKINPHHDEVSERTLT